MTNPASEITVKPESLLLEDLLTEISQGYLRVPRFVRQFLWRAEEIAFLFDSIDRGYPIGSIVIWETDRKVPSLEHVGNLTLPPPSVGRTSYILDGWQRVCSLYGCLVSVLPRQASGEASERDWRWSIYRVLGDDGWSNRFQYWRGSSEPPANYLPMHAVLRTMDFLVYARKLSNSFRRAADEALIDEAEQFAQRIKSYRVSIVRVVGGSFGSALEIFARLNGAGQPMSYGQMVSAVTYVGGAGENLADRIGYLQESVGDFGEVPSTTIFRSILAVAGEADVQQARWQVLADRVKGRLSVAVKETELSLRRAVQFLREQIGVPSARLVPYSAQLMLIVAFFAFQPYPSPEQERMLVRWFWSTSWSGFFAGANSTQIKNALLEMRRFAAGRGQLVLNGQVARPFPERFDLHSARVRVFILWELREFGGRLAALGEPVDAVGLLARSDTKAYRHVISSGVGTLVSSPANRLILPTEPGVSVVATLLDAPERVAASHGVPPGAVRRLREGDGEGFIRERAAFLAGLEREFMAEVGVRPAPELVGEAEIDTE